MSQRLSQRLATLHKTGRRKGLVVYITAGDPDFEQSLAMLNALPAHGADIIELGMPFSDPAADGTVIQDAAGRALESGTTLGRTLELVAAFRRHNTETPVVLMGYYNPIYRFGPTAFIDAALAVGADALLVVDLPPEFDDELATAAGLKGLTVIRLLSPTTDRLRRQRILETAAGFAYYVALKGVTGAALAGFADVNAAVAAIRQDSGLPVAVGFGIRSPADVRQLNADLIVVGSAVIALWQEQGAAAALSLVEKLSQAG